MGSRPKPRLLITHERVAAYQGYICWYKMLAAKSFVASLLLASTHGFGNFQSIDFAKMMKMRALSSQFAKDKIDADQSNSLMKFAGYSDFDLFASKQISATDFKQSMKQQMKDQMIQQILNSGGCRSIESFVQKNIFWRSR